MASAFLRLGMLTTEYLVSLVPAILFVCILGPLVFWFLGFYKTLIRAFDFRSVNTLATGCALLGVSLAAFAYFRGGFLLPRSTPLIFILVTFMALGTSRIIARWFYVYSLGSNKSRSPILIYGAGEAGNKIASILSGSTEFSLVGFIDDDKTLHGSFMRGRKVYAIKNLDDLVSRYGNIRILLSIKNLTPANKREIFERLNRPGITVQVIPSLTDVVVGRDSIESIREIQIEDLLGRDIVPPIPAIFKDALAGSIVLVTGGGGSIGSEVCKQVVANAPKKLVLLEQSEFALYRIEQQLSALQTEAGTNVSIEYCLGRVDDRKLVAHLLQQHRPDLVVHTAAYKHVPIVENNILEAVRNNIIATNTLADECRKNKIARFMLVSTDKAVRPTNIMGATKRFAEMVIQSQAEEAGVSIFSMVRFGNVLGSSGSVVPLFKEQIAKGGPVTVTHKEITRYFMTIPEAAQLVIQAAYIATGGEVFVLDMGEPVKIDALARMAVRLSGKTVRDDENPTGDIAIEYVGLRPGEKLYEELLIGGNAAPTEHPKIMQASEICLEKAKLKAFLEQLEKAVSLSDPSLAIKILNETVSGIKLDNRHQDAQKITERNSVVTFAR